MRRYSGGASEGNAMYTESDGLQIEVVKDEDQNREILNRIE